MEIKYVDFGIGSRINNQIFLNSKLKLYPNLHNAILQHEKAHSSGFNWSDLMIDFKNTHLRGLKLQYYRFILENPSSWSEFLPIWRNQGNWAINPLLLGLYGLIISIIGIIGVLLW